MAKSEQVEYKPRKVLLAERAMHMKHDPDQTPIEIPDLAPPTLREELQAYIRNEISGAAKRYELGSFEDEDDFEAEDPDPEFTSKYELQDMQDDAVAGDYVESVSGPEAPETTQEAQKALDLGHPTGSEQKDAAAHSESIADKSAENPT